MKDFMLDENGELVIQNGRILTVSDKNLTAQKVKQVIRTQLGEWEYDTEEGIDRYVMLTKNPNYDLVEDNIRLGLLQVDESFRITDFNCSEGKNRQLKVNFTATNDTDGEVSIEM